MSNPFPCNSIGNAQCAMANEIQRYRHNLIPSALKRRPKVKPSLRDEEQEAPNHSYRKAIIGSIRDARRAGRKPASAATAIITSVASAMVSGSVGDNSNSK